MFMEIVENKMADTAVIDRNRRVVAEFLAGTHSGRLEVIDATVAEGILTRGFPGGNPTSREEYKEWFRAFRSGFSGMVFETLATVADETNVAVRWRVTVDHTGPFAGVEPTGKRVSFEGVALYRLANGLIVETSLYIDELALLVQVGALPALAA
jgi:predicted ester cyclase